MNSKKYEVKFLEKGYDSDGDAERMSWSRSDSREYYEITVDGVTYNYIRGKIYRINYNTGWDKIDYYYEIYVGENKIDNEELKEEFEKLISVFKETMFYRKREYRNSDKNQSIDINIIKEYTEGINVDLKENNYNYTEYVVSKGFDKYLMYTGTDLRTGKENTLTSSYPLITAYYEGKLHEVRGEYIDYYDEDTVIDEYGRAHTIKKRNNNSDYLDELKSAIDEYNKSNKIKVLS